MLLSYNRVVFDSHIVETQPVEPTQPVRRRGDPLRRRRGCLTPGLILVLLFMLAAIGFFSAWMLVEAIERSYEDRIYPNVYVLDIAVGGLGPDEATERLAEVAGQRGVGVVVLGNGERGWPLSWADLGMSLDVETTVQAAFAVGHADHPLWTLLSLLVHRREVAPVFVINTVVAWSALEQLAPEVSTPPANATLVLQSGQLVAVPGRAGRVLDIEATLTHLLAAAAGQGSGNQIALAFATAPPRILDASPAQAQAEELLNRYLYVSTYDVLTDETFGWALGRDVLIDWLRVVQDVEGNGLLVHIDQGAVRVTLENLAAELEGGRGFRLEEAVEQVLGRFEAGGGAVELYMTHPARSYTVQSGDTLGSIAASFGMPPGIIAEANRGVDLDRLRVGQRLTVPSQDVLTPYIAVPGKRIVVSIAGQRMRVYEDDQLLYDWPISTGIASSPTYTGVFQILSKEESAYASQWDLWMPHFLAIYRAGSDVYNGIHALPILSSGQRLWVGALGSPASYGCIILGVEEAEALYRWAGIGVVVVVE
jgi:lipoprotein-anchoring transpeptidase ErfK/SrfK